ncbi:MAG: NUDIX domain-containing protein [Clostridia bacterium]|nr:NUDIX domain-containing protein [Deltaproteobacteria bacterium]
MTQIKTACGIPVNHVLAGDADKAREITELAIASRPFSDWLEKLDRARFDVRSVTIQSVDMFGPRVGFIKFKADVYDSNGKFLPGIVVMRGGSVAMVTVLVCEGRRYAVVVIQPRLPTASFEFVELPAGMLDGSGNFGGVAAKEMEEELGLKISENDLIDLGELAGFKDGAYVSPGITDECIRFFAYTKAVTKAELQELKGRTTGVIDEGEQITVTVVPFHKLARVADLKTLAGYWLYKQHVTARPRKTRRKGA